METSIVSVAIILFAFIIIAKGIKIVSQTDSLVIERLGKYHATLSGGLNFIIPIIDSVRSRLSMQEQTIDIPSQSVITKDNVNITIDGIVFCRVEDAKSAIYSVMDFKNAIERLAQTTLRSEIGSLNLDDCLSNRESLNVKLQTALGDAATQWGVKVTRVEISDISVPVEIQKAMNKQMEAEREKRAIQTKAEGEKQSEIYKAEGEKEAKYLEAEAIMKMADARKYEQEKIAEGQKNAMESINEALAKNEKAAEFLLAKDRIAAFHALASSDSKDKVILPYDVTQMIGSMSVLGDAFLKGVSGGNSNS